MTDSINRDFFFDTVKSELFDGALKKSQSDGLSVILHEWSRTRRRLDDRWLAYALATTHHETGRTMQPIREWGSKKYFFDMYDPFGQRPDVAKRLGNKDKGDGVLFHGRGYVQLTGRGNYKKWSDKLGVDLISDPDKALITSIAITILIIGMEEGSFTGKKLADYFNTKNADWRGARRIINGTDKADLIASYGKKYYSALSYTV